MPSAPLEEEPGLPHSPAPVDHSEAPLGLSRQGVETIQFLCAIEEIHVVLLSEQLIAPKSW
jgi:hypothetical protein